jgi:hypothetical protein
MPLYGVMSYYYKKVFEDFYGKKLNKEEESQIDMLQQKDVEATINFDQKRFSVEK